MLEHFSKIIPFSNLLSNNEKVRIKFISGDNSSYNNIFLNPSYWILKSFYELYGKNIDKITWLDGIYHNLDLNEKTVTDFIEKEQPHVICFGLYCWNQELYSRLGKFIKQNWPNIIIIAGGPEIFAHKELELFWEKYNWIDLALYGDAEEAFTLLIDYLFGNVEEEKLINLSFKDKNNIPQIIPFVVFKNNDFKLVSPFLKNKEIINKAVKEIKQKNLNIIISWNFTKGCPYACSFCDWSSGLHHKVTRKKYDWKLDLDFLSSLDVEIRWVDANVGMFKDDIDIIKYAYELENKNKNFSFNFRNVAKIHKKSVFEILDYIESVKPGIKRHNLALQDIHEDVLLSLDRPDIPWEEYKKYIIEIKKNHPNIHFELELMIGLPNQSLEIFSKTLTEITSVNPVAIESHFWSMLVNSPGYDEDYRKKFNLKTFKTYVITKIPKNMHSRNDVLQNIDNCESYLSSVILESNAASMGDIIAMYCMVVLYNVLNGYKNIHLPAYHKIISNIDFWRNFGNSFVPLLEKDLHLNKKILLLLELHGKPVTFYDYFNDKQTLLSLLKQAYKANITS